MALLFEPFLLIFDRAAVFFSPNFEKLILAYLLSNIVYLGLIWLAKKERIPIWLANVFRVLSLVLHGLSLTGLYIKHCSALVGLYEPLFAIAFFYFAYSPVLEFDIRVALTTALVSSILYPAIYLFLWGTKTFVTVFGTFVIKSPHF